MNTIEEQKLLETNMVKAGISRFNQALNKMKEKGLESATKHGRAIMATQIEPVAQGIIELLEKPSSNRAIAKKKLQYMDASEVAYISMIAMVDNLTKPCSTLKLASQIGMRIEDQLKLQLWVEHEAQKAKLSGERVSLAKNMIRWANEKTRSGRVQKRKGLNHKINSDAKDAEKIGAFQFNNWSYHGNNSERIQVGSAMINIIIVTTGIVELRKVRTGKNKTTNYIFPTQKTVDWIKRFNSEAEIARPRYTPTIIPPKDWNYVQGGGYYASIINDLPLVRVH